MKFLIVTSQVTYVPDNYRGLLVELFRHYEPQSFQVLILQNLDRQLWRQLFGLFWLGARRLGGTLLKNVLFLPLKQREKLCESNGVRVRYAKSVNDPEVLAWVKEERFDLVCNVRTRCFYRAEILVAPRLGCINVHHGLLPKYRGTLCDLYALVEGRDAGFSIHVMTPKLDDGRILQKMVTSKAGEKDYILHLQRSASREGEELAHLLAAIEKLGALPQGEANSGEDVNYNKTTIDRVEIAKIKTSGIKI